MHLVFDEVVLIGRQEAIHFGVFPCYCHYAERLARLEQVPIFKVLV